jgi:hypothetical protein
LAHHWNAVPLLDEAEVYLEQRARQDVVFGGRQGSSFVCNRPHNEYDAGSAEMDNLQNTGHTDPIASTNSSGEAHLSIARFPSRPSP